MNVKGRDEQTCPACLPSAALPPDTPRRAESARQQSGPTNPRRGPRVIEETVVTARKRVENIQDVGLSVGALSQDEIENNYARDIRDLVSVSPSLVLDDTAQGPGVVVDGIFLGTMTGGITHAIDLESVEVLRGPQGTLFGRNTLGGVINLRRTKPTGELGGKLRASCANFETSRLAGLLNFGLGDMVAVKLTGAFEDQSKGYYKNVHTGAAERRPTGSAVLRCIRLLLAGPAHADIRRSLEDQPVRRGPERRKFRCRYTRVRNALEHQRFAEPRLPVRLVEDGRGGAHRLRCREGPCYSTPRAPRSTSKPPTNCA